MPSLVPNIWLLQSRGDVDGLINALRHVDAGTRRGAAAALRALGVWHATPALQAALAVESDWQAHAAIAAAIQYLDHDIHIESLIKNRDVRGLAKMLNSARHEDIITACQALESIGDKQAVEPLVMVFRNTLLPNKVRLIAAEALLKLESAPAMVTLLGALRRDEWQVRRNAATVLGQLQAAWATEPLIKALEDINLEVRRAAAEALRRIGTAEAIAATNIYEGRQVRLDEEAMEAPRMQEPMKQLAARLPTPPVLQPPPQPDQPKIELPHTPVEPDSARATQQHGIPQKKPQTGKLPPLPDMAQPEAPPTPMVKRLAVTDRLTALPEYQQDRPRAVTASLPPLPAAPEPTVPSAAPIITSTESGTPDQSVYPSAAPMMGTKPLTYLPPDVTPTRGEPDSDGSNVPGDPHDLNGGHSKMPEDDLPA